VAGNFLANQNNPYPNVRIPIGLNYRVFDIAPQEWVTMSLVASDTYRGVTWTDERFIPRTVNFNLENMVGALNVDLGLEMESSGTAGVAGHYPTEPPEDDYVPPSTPVPPPWSPVIDDWEGIWVVGCWGDLAGSQPGILRTENLGGVVATAPVWSAWNTGIDMANFPYCRAIMRDPWSPKTRLYCVMSSDDPGTWNEAGFVMYRRTYSGGVWGSWTAVLNEVIIESTVGYAINAGTGRISRPAANINAKGHLYCMVTVHRTSDNWMPQYFFKSTDYGATWTATRMQVEPENSPQVMPICVKTGKLRGTSGFGAGQVIYASYRNRSAFHYPAISVSTTQGGAPWTYVDGGAAADQKGVRIAVDTNDQSILYALGDGQNQDGNYAVQKYTGDGAAGPVLQAAWGSCTRAPTTKSGNSLTMFAAASTVLKESYTGGTTVGSIAVTGNDAAAGFPLNWDWSKLMAVHSYNNGQAGTRYFQLSPDGGITWYNKHGNMAGNFNGLISVGFSLDN